MLKRLKVRLRALLRKNEMEHELDEEMRDHLERIVEQHLAQGMTLQEARRAALRDFGGFEQAKEEIKTIGSDLGRSLYKLITFII